MKFLPEVYTHNIMIKERNVGKANRYFPKTLEELIEFVRSPKWTFDSDKIDLYLLKFDNDSEFEKVMHVYPVKYNIINEEETWSIFKLQTSASDASVVYLPGHYQVCVLTDSNKYIIKPVDQLTVHDKILSRLFDSVIITQPVHSIEHKGLYKFDTFVDLEIPDNMFVPIGTTSVQILVK